MKWIDARKKNPKFSGTFLVISRKWQHEHGVYVYLVDYNADADPGRVVFDDIDFWCVITMPKGFLH